MISGELLKINNQSVPSCRSYAVQYEKVWATKNRNMNGDFRGTLLGEDIIITAEFGGELLKNDVQGLLSKLTSGTFSLTFYDPKSDSTKTALYYLDNYEASVLSKHKGQYHPINIQFLPVSRSS